MHAATKSAACRRPPRGRCAPCLPYAK
jgi:hypothetical protein